MKALHQGTQWLRYAWKAGTKHDVHSPFVYKLYTEVISSKSNPAISEKIEKIRLELRSDLTSIQVRDYGSAARGSHYSRTISSIAKSSSKSPKIAHMLWRLANTSNARCILDLGTSLGLTTAYLASASEGANVHTFEGCPETLKVAQSNFQKLNIRNVTPHIGDLSETLPSVLAGIDQIDVAFFDANHQYQPTLDYFNLCLEKKHNESLFIFDDIHWSEGMTRAWQEICQHPSVTVSIDLYQVGLVFFRKEQVKQHFCLRF